MLWILDVRRDCVRKLRLWLAVLLLLLAEAGGIVVGSDYLRNHVAAYEIQFEAEESDLFREQNISDENIKLLKQFSKKYNISPIRILSAVMVTHNYNMKNQELQEFSPEKLEQLEDYLHKNYKKEYENLLILYGKIWHDVEYFPVAESKENEEATVSFENSWMYERNFGGKRGHEGTDIMAAINKRGYYPIVSMTDGVVEKVGWLTKGGYRLGIRSQSGGYYYYAHLYRYAQEFEPGDVIKAGQLLGYMGDSGYGSEGTVGQFAVHLHLGIYINGEDGEEISVNPYPVLKYFEEKTLKYDY